jgi:hypothetical protein
MAAAPQWKVYDAAGVYQAACKEIEAAAALMGFYGNGATIRSGHGKIVFTEGGDANADVFGYDSVVEMVYSRI